MRTLLPIFSVALLTLSTAACGGPSNTAYPTGSHGQISNPQPQTSAVDSRPASTPSGERRLGTTAMKLSADDSAYGCGDITNDGICDLDTLMFCDRGQLWAIDCANHGLTCGFSDSYGWFDCVEPLPTPPPTPVSAPAAPDSCGGLDFAGACFGPEVQWCEGGQIAAVDCAASGQTCDWLPEMGYYGCVDYAPPTPPVDPCEGVSFEGECVPGGVMWCENDTVQSIGCEFGCGWDPAGYNNCLPEPVVVVVVEPEPTDPCATMPWEGVCDGPSLLWCENGTLNEVVCDTGCGFDPAGYNDCLPAPPVDPCEGVSFEGECAGDTVLWCADGQLQTLDCPYGCDYGENGYFDCLPY